MSVSGYAVWLSGFALHAYDGIGSQLNIITRSKHRPYHTADSISVCLFDFREQSCATCRMLSMEIACMKMQYLMSCAR